VSDWSDVLEKLSRSFNTYGLGDLRSGCLDLGGGRFRRCDVNDPFKEYARVKRGSGADEGSQVRGGDGPPAGLCSVDRFLAMANPCACDRLRNGWNSSPQRVDDFLEIIRPRRRGQLTTRDRPGRQRQALAA
jgi:hypothetical protein